MAPGVQHWAMLGRREHLRTPPALTVVGLDPGLANLGLGAVRQDYRSVTHLGSELVRTDARAEQSERLIQLHDATRAFLERHRPDALALEGQYFHRQRAVAFKVGQAVGVCLIVTAQLDIPVFEYGPMQVKQALVGSGRASKEQVSYMVRAMLGLRQTPESHHVADALALALTHLNSYKLQGLAPR